MQNFKLSKLQFYSMGIVAVNKALDSKVIEVVPIEEFPMLNGELSDSVSSYKAELKNAQNEPFKVDIKSSASIKATWVPINQSNRRTAPDVRRGEAVMIYRFADTDSYWWNTLKNDNTLRRLETVIYSFNNMTAENVEDGPDTTYWLEVSTHQQLIHVHTSKNRGEPFAYDLQIDAKNGKLTFTDDADNYFIIDSANSNVRLANTNGSFVEINKTNINISCSNKISMKCNDLQVDAGNTVTINTGKTTINSPTDNNGHVNINGGLSVS